MPIPSICISPIEIHTLLFIGLSWTFHSSVQSGMCDPFYDCNNSVRLTDSSCFTCFRIGAANHWHGFTSDFQSSEKVWCCLYIEEQHLSTKGSHQSNARRHKLAISTNRGNHVHQWRDKLQWKIHHAAIQCWAILLESIFLFLDTVTRSTLCTLGSAGVWVCLWTGS